MDKRRVVVTGMGQISALGLTVDNLWNNLKAGKSGVTLVSNVDLKDSPSLIAGEVKNADFDPADYMDRRMVRRMDRFSHFAMYAADRAVEDSGLDTYKFDPAKVGVIIGSGIGGIHTYYDNSIKLYNGGYKRVSPLFIPLLIVDIASGNISIKHNFQGPNYSVSSACATASHALSVSYNHIILGDADIMVCGGSEAALSPLAFAGFTQAKALSKRNDEPEKASRPFDKDRDGFVMGEGAGVLILEELEHAKKRGATIYGEMLGYGMSADAYHITAPRPDGQGGGLAMRNALNKCNLKPEDIQLVNTHGTSTSLGDIAETQAIKQVFGKHAYQMKINSTKSMTGHTLGASGGIEAIAVLKMLETGIVHPTINLDNPDPKCDLDYVPNKAIEFQAEYAISNSFGFGGHDVTLVFKKY